jgi:hypothetical protein
MKRCQRSNESKTSTLASSLSIIATAASSFGRSARSLPPETDGSSKIALTVAPLSSASSSTDRP